MTESPNPQNQRRIKDVLTQFIVFIVIVSVFVFGSTFLARSLTAPNQEEVEKIVKNVIQEKYLPLRPTCAGTLDEFQDLRDSGKVLRIANNNPSYAENGNLIGGTKPTVMISGQDEIGCGYLYIRVSKSHKPFDPNFDSVYINPQGFGGHILRNKGIMLNDQGEYTEALIPLDAVAYLPNVPYDPNAQNFHIANWVNLLNVNSHVDFDLALSTLDKGGLIEDVSIAYKCWNNETGTEANNCQLSLQ